MSDIHLEFEDFVPPAEPGDAPADVVVLAGDIAPGFEGLEWVVRTFPDRPIVIVPGNHELYRQMVPDFLGLVLERARSLGISLLSDGEVAIDGVRFLGAMR
jgi:predicted phosphodiesterase